MHNTDLKKLEFLKAIGYKFVNKSSLVGFAYYKNLDSLNSDIKKCFLCHLRNGVKNPFSITENSSSRLMFVNFMPSQTEEQSGQPWKDKEWFSALIYETLGLKTDEYRISYAVKCHAKDSNINHTDSCLSYLFEEIRLVNPKVIVTLGSEVFRCFFANRNLNGIRGTLLKFENSILMPTFSPDWLVKNPSHKDDFVNDLNRLKGIL
ncbi:uracil-DNA glycosylase family protein [Campylobacter mucosalis]|uniref:uracil-DNA glycosylase family protein n=1 Tax=Campylobacter mucosalis TaxID=202 RepID=UPI00147047DD|nr:uracil-DNA glycosylase family protein [Campylobacter mucosalis]